MSIELREITERNRAAVESLRVSAAQERFIDSVAESISEAESSPEAQPWYRAIYVEGIPVGFVMISEGASGDDRYPWRYFLWKLLIDERFQRRGYGRETLNMIAAELRTRSDADALFTSVVSGEGSPVSFYQRYGFVRTGQIFDHEVVLRLDLAGSLAPRRRDAARAVVARLLGRVRR